MLFRDYQEQRDVAEVVEKMIDGVRGVLRSLDQHDYLLRLNRYQLDNLLALLYLIYQKGGPANVLSTGDWCGELYWALCALTGTANFDLDVHHPNLSPENQAVALRRRAQHDD